MDTSKSITDGTRARRRIRNLAADALRATQLASTAPTPSQTPEYPSNGDLFLAKCRRIRPIDDSVVDVPMLREFGEAAGHVFSQMNTGMRDSRLHGSQPAWPGDLHCELEQLVEKVAKQQTVLDCDKLRLAAIAGNTVHYFWSQRRESWHSDLGVIP